MECNANPPWNLVSGVLAITAVSSVATSSCLEGKIMVPDTYDYEHVDRLSPVDHTKSEVANELTSNASTSSASCTAHLRHKVQTQNFQKKI